MKISDRTYNILKWVGLALCPALEVLVLTVGKIWYLPYYAEVGATIAAIGVFIAAVIGVTSSNYYAEIGEKPYQDDVEGAEIDDGEEVDG